MSRKEFLVHVIRHADAGTRGAVNDDRRPLSRRGRAQADGVAAVLADAGIERLLSSPFTRCLETLAPLGARLGIPVESRDDLAEGAGGRGALTLVEGTSSPFVLCSHGDVIGDLLVTLDRRGVPLDDDRCAKGSTWALTVRAGTVVAAHYVPAPKTDST